MLNLDGLIISCRREYYVETLLPFFWFQYCFFIQHFILRAGLFEWYVTGCTEITLCLFLDYDMVTFCMVSLSLDHSKQRYVFLGFNFLLAVSCRKMTLCLSMAFDWNTWKVKRTEIE